MLLTCRSTLALLPWPSTLSITQGKRKSATDEVANEEDRDQKEGYALVLEWSNDNGVEMAQRG